MVLAVKGRFGGRLLEFSIQVVYLHLFIVSIVFKCIFVVRTFVLATYSLIIRAALVFTAQDFKSHSCTENVNTKEK